MATISSNTPQSLPQRSGIAWDRATRFWVAATIMGQALFVVFIYGFYYVSTLSGDWSAWDSKPLIEGFVAGDLAGNAAFAAHVLMAGAMTAAGIVQLIPWVRRNRPALHRWSGRVFLLLAIGLSSGGLWLVWGRSTYLTLTGAVAISLDGALLIGASILAWRHARARDFAAHRRWALRAFMLASGVWFMRVGYMAWGIGTGGAGIGDNMNGPFDLFWAFGCWAVPLAMLELYFRAERAEARGVRWSMTAIVAIAGLAIAAGSIGAWFVMWGPYV
jgi:hypothetical protein